MTKEELESFIIRHNAYFQRFLLSLLGGKVARRYIPSLVFTTEQDCYTNHEKIVIGLDQPDYPDENSLFAFVYFVIAHECQHVRSTPSKPWMWGINTGTKYVIEYFLKQYKMPVPQVAGEQALRMVVQKIRDSGHLIPRYETIQRWCHFYMNALEDGRIEQIMTAQYPGLISYIRMARGTMWQKNAEEDYERPMTASDKLQLYGNEILSLSTCQIFEKDFWAYYDGTDEEKLLSSSIRDHVSRAVYAPRCKQGMEHAVEIVKLLTPTFFESVQEHPEQQFLEQLLEAMMSSLAAMDPTDGSEIKEGNEAGNNTPGQSPFGQSSLKIPVLDKDGNLTGDVKEDEKEPESGDKEKTEGKENSEKSSPSSSGKNSESEKKDPEKSGSGQKGNEKTGKEEGKDSGKNSSTSDSSEEDEEEAGNDSSDNDEPGKKNENSDNSQNDGSDRRKTDNTGNRTRGSYKGDFSEDELLEEMKKASERINDDLSASSGNSKSFENHGTDHFDDSSTAAQGADVHKVPFTEKQRLYKVDIPLPFVIVEKGRILKDRAERFFKPRKNGDYRKRQSGKVDAGKLASLAVNELDFFKRKKKPEKNSICGYILQDNSGSMGGGRNSKRMFASEASAMIEFAFKDYMPLKIAAFDEMGKVIHEVIKNWDDNTRESCSYNFFWKGREGCGNNDADSIVIATEELLARKEKDKILVIISDGLPCGSAAYKGKTPDNAVKEAVNYARQKGIKVVGIYIEETVNDSVRKTYENMYGSQCVFTDTDHIGDDLIKVMAGWVFNR